MEIFKENSFTAEAQKRLAAQKGKLEQTRDSLRQGELLMIDRMCYHVVLGDL